MEGADGGGENPAPVDVGHQQDCGPGLLGHPEVDQVVLLQIQLHGAAGPLQNDELMLAAEAAEALHHQAGEPRFVPVIFLGREVAVDLAVDDHLGAHLAAGLEQYGIHVHVGGQAGRLGLHHLGPPHLAALRGDEAVQGHVLGLEGRHPQALLAEDAAEAGSDDALAYVRAGPQDH